MKLSRNGQRAPRTLVGWIAVVTMAPLLTLLWLGWHLVEQDRLLERQQVQQRVERAGDLVVAALQRRLSQAQQELSSGTAQPARGVAVFAFPAALPEAPIATFDASDDLELRQRDPQGAIKLLRPLVARHDRAVAAGALLRYARCLNAAGLSEEALAAYLQLSQMDDVAVSGVPAALVGLYARGRVLEQLHRTSELETVATHLDARLRSGRWLLPSAVFSVYMQDAVRWSNGLIDARDAEVFGEALATLQRRLDASAARGDGAAEPETLQINGQMLTVLQHLGSETPRFLVATSSFVSAYWLDAIEPIAHAQHVRVEILQPQTLGGAPQSVHHQATRIPIDSGLPWSLAIASTDPPPEHSNFVVRRYLLIAGFALLMVMAAAASYLVVRAVGRELAVARMQADFVAAVSHEFRTPLTTLRQFTDMLREQPALGLERRIVAFEAQARATDRLANLVESILDFGRMQAGAHHYQFASQDCTVLVKRVVDDFSTDARAAGHDVAFDGSVPIRADIDAETISTALRNLLDNAVKYSARGQKVEVALERRNGHVLISVRDHGIGIPPHERHQIFTKFHRGEQARVRGIRGTGIGLAMVHEIVKAHRGRVDVESTVGTGSTFTIELPSKE